MRVLLVHEYYRSSAPSGEDRVFENEKSLLALNDVGVKTVTVRNDMIGTSQGPSLFRTALYTIWSPFGVRLMREAILRYKPDVVHFHNTFPLLSQSAIYQAKKMGIATVQTLHNFRWICANAMLLGKDGLCERCIDCYPWPALMRRCYRDSLWATLPLALNIGLHRFMKTWNRKVDRFIVLSEFSKIKFIEAGLPSEKIAVKPNFIEDVSVNCGRKDGSWIYVGRVTEEKGVQFIPQVWNRMGDNAPILIIVGDGPYRAKLKKEIAGIGLQQKIIFHGQCVPDDVRRLIGKASLLLFPSIWYEVFGLVIVEAYQQGVPVAAAKIGTPAFIVRDGETGVHFKPGDVADMADRLSALAKNPDVLIRMGRKARAEYEAYYTPEKNLKCLLEIYEEAIQLNKSVSMNQ